MHKTHRNTIRLHKGFAMKDIKIQKTQAFLEEILALALSNLSNPKLNCLSITHIECSRGKQHAKVFIESSAIPQEERSHILSQLKKATPILKEYTLSATSWFKCPDLSFCFDDGLRAQSNLEAIFKQIAK